MLRAVKEEQLNFLSENLKEIFPPQLQTGNTSQNQAWVLSPVSKLDRRALSCAGVSHQTPHISTRYVIP